MNTSGKAVLQIAAALLAASALQACAGANVLAAIDGPFVPPSEREDTQRTTEVVTIVDLAPATPAPEPEPEPPAPTTAPMVTAAEPVTAAPARIGRDFLAPPSLAPASAPQSGGVIGPEQPAPEAPVQLATRLPSAFDYTPPVVAEPELEPEPANVALPAAETPTSAVTAYAAFHRFALERLAASPAGAGRRSMLLADPASLDPALQTCGPRPPAVLIDLDPANSLLPLVTTNRADPLLAALLADLRGRGVAVYWITGHAPGAAAAIRQRLVDSTLDPTGNDPLIVTRFASETKQVRRQTLGQTHCLLAILGDYRGDFDELYDYLRDPALADPLEVLVDHGWFLAPNPLG